MTSDPAFDSLCQIRLSYGTGSTPTEKLLRALGERSFLRFWSHATPRVSPTQELCDLLVICGEYVFVFSDKGANYQFDEMPHIAWTRWYRSAVAKSIKQLRGAYRNLFVLGSPIYKDTTCGIALDLPLPIKERAKIYLIGSGSLTIEDNQELLRQPFLAIDGGLVGDQHISRGATPMCIGDVSPGTEFVHFFDFAGLWAVLQELDTVVDFARYLDAREAFIRAQGRNTATNEWAILTRHLLSFTPSGDFVPLDSANPGFTRLGDGERHAESTRRALHARKDANRGSYLWDDLIERLARNIEQQSFKSSTYHTVKDAERVVRDMALEPRLKRRILANCWKEACLSAKPGNGINLRTMPHDEDSAVTYLFMTMLQAADMTDEIYHNHRLELLKKLALAPFHEDPTTEIVIGLASELGQPPETLDRVYFKKTEDTNRESLAADAKVNYEFKREHFEDPVAGVVEEREMPST